MKIIIKTLSLMELFHIIKKEIRHPTLNLQKCYKLILNIRVGSQGPRTEGCLIWSKAESQINTIELKISVFVPSAYLVCPERVFNESDSTHLVHIFCIISFHDRKNTGIEN